MLNSENFVIYNKTNEVVWQTLYFPTDIILGGQNLFSHGELFSRLSKTNYSTGQFRLKMQDDGNLVLYPAHTSDVASNAYWASNTMGYTPGYLCLRGSGQLLLLNTTDFTPIETLIGPFFTNNGTTIYHVTVNYDGVFRLYSHILDSKGDYKTKIEWKAPDDLCVVKNFCGFNSYCTFNDDQPLCRCLPGSTFVDPNQNCSGCETTSTKELCKFGKENKSSYHLIDIEEMTLEDLPYFRASVPEADCRMSCLQDCNCDIGYFYTRDFLKYRLPLRYIIRDSKANYTTFFKVGTSVNTTGKKPQVLVITGKKPLVLILVVTLGFAVCSCVALAICGIFTFEFRVVKYRRLLSLTRDLTLRSFSYNELKKATNGFKQQLGKGSFGTVYKGTLHKGKRPVAVKRLEKLVNEGEREFQAKMRVIGRTHHKNLVRLLGYCAQDSKRPCSQI